MGLISQVTSWDQEVFFNSCDSSRADRMCRSVDMSTECFHLGIGSSDDSYPIFSSSNPGANISVCSARTVTSSFVKMFSFSSCCSKKYETLVSSPLKALKMTKLRKSFCSFGFKNLFSGFPVPPSSRSCLDQTSSSHEQFFRFPSPNLFGRPHHHGSR